MGTKVRVDDRQAKLNMRARFRRAEDFRPVFRWAQREMERANRANFATEGVASGAAWKPLDPKYGAWKLAHYGAKPILVLTRDLKSSLTSLRGYPNEIGRKVATFGTDVEYAKFHQSGTSKMAQRTIVFIPPLFAQAMSQQVLSHILYGKLGVGGAPIQLLKGLFPG